jgi:hypothetical protein
LTGVFDATLENGRHRYGRSDVVVGAWQALEQVVNLELLHQILGAGGGCIASAHGFERICGL